MALGGKTLRGSRRRGAADAHLLAALNHRLGVTLGQAGVPDKTNEIGAVAEFLLTPALEGRIVTADALLTRREIAQAILHRFWTRFSKTIYPGSATPRIDRCSRLVR